MSGELCCSGREHVPSTFCFAKRWSQKAPTIQANDPPRTSSRTSPRWAVAARIVDTYRTHPADTLRLLFFVVRIERLGSVPMASVDDERAVLLRPRSSSFHLFPASNAGLRPNPHRVRASAKRRPPRLKAGAGLPSNRPAARRPAHLPAAGGCRADRGLLPHASCRYVSAGMLGCTHRAPWALPWPPPRVLSESGRCGCSVNYRSARKPLDHPWGVA